VHRFDASRLAHSLHRDRAPPARTPSRDLLHTLGIVRILLVSDLHYTLPQLDWVVRSAPQFDLVVLAGDQLDISSTVSLDAQSVVILRYLALLQAAGRVVIGSGNHDLTGPDAQGEQAALWLAEARDAGVPTDGDSLSCGDTLVTICPVVGWPARPRRRRGAAGGRCRAQAEALDLGLPLAAARIAHVLDRQAPLRRRRFERMDRRARAGCGAHWPRPRVAVQARRLVGRPHRSDLGVQRRPPDRPGAVPCRHRSRRGHRVVAIADGQRKPEPGGRARACADALLKV
jgi:hypothetical protein